jgi:hypothetical protein
LENDAAVSRGGGIYTYYGNTEITNTTFEGDSGITGVAVYFNNPTVTIITVTTRTF